MSITRNGHPTQGAFFVIDSRTGKVCRTLGSLQAARRTKDRLDTSHGAYIYVVVDGDGRRRF